MTTPLKCARFRIAVGRTHGVKPGNIVGAIANEAGLDSRYIGHIDIQDDCSLVDLPAGMPKDILHDLKTARVAGQMLNIEPAGEAAADYSPNSGSGGGQRRDRVMIVARRSVVMAHPPAAMAHRHAVTVALAVANALTAAPAAKRKAPRLLAVTNRAFADDKPQVRR